MANDIGNALVPQPGPLVGPPAPQPGGFAGSAIGRVLLPPPGVQGPPRQPGQSAQVPSGLNPIQAIMYKVQNDPNFARAMTAAGLDLLQSSKDNNSIRNYAHAAQTGLSTLDQGQQREQGQAAEAKDKTWKQAQEERRTAATEKQQKTEAESARRKFILEQKAYDAAEKRGASAEKLDQMRYNLELKRLQIDQAKGAGTTQAERDMTSYTTVVKERAAKMGVTLSEGEAFQMAKELQLQTEAKGGNGLSPGQVFGPIVGAGLGNANMGEDTGPIIKKAAQDTQAVMEAVTPVRQDPMGNLNAQLQMRKPFPADVTKIQLPKDDVGRSAQVSKIENGIVTLEVITPDGAQLIQKPESWLRQIATW